MWGRVTAVVSELGMMSYETFETFCYEWDADSKITVEFLKIIVNLQIWKPIPGALSITLPFNLHLRIRFGLYALQHIFKLYFEENLPPLSIGEKKITSHTSSELKISSMFTNLKKMWVFNKVKSSRLKMIIMVSNQNFRIHTDIAFSSIYPYTLWIEISLIFFLNWRWFAKNLRRNEFCYSDYSSILLQFVSKWFKTPQRVGARIFFMSKIGYLRKKKHLCTYQYFFLHMTGVELYS